MLKALRLKIKVVEQSRDSKRKDLTRGGEGGTNRNKDSLSEPSIVLEPHYP